MHSDAIFSKNLASCLSWPKLMEIVLQKKNSRQQLTNPVRLHLFPTWKLSIHVHFAAAYIIVSRTYFSRVTLASVAMSSLLYTWPRLEILFAICTASCDGKSCWAKQYNVRCPYFMISYGGLLWDQKCMLIIMPDISH